MKTDFNVFGKFSTKVVAPLESWWARPDVQADREAFTTWARAEQPRILGNQRFGGTKKTHDKFTQEPNT